MRQWVITVPQPLRAMLAYDTTLCGVVLNEFIKAVISWLRYKAKSEFGLATVAEAYPGAITALQRF